MGKYKHFIGLGVAGNFALHLDQAGEAEDFKDIVTKDEYAPKGMFPFFLPRVIIEADKAQLHANKMLTTYPLGADNIKLPKNKEYKVQAEPEVALICDLEYTVGKLSKITPRYFGAYNDCSIRIQGASKISEKKNWGHESKGFSNTLISIDKFAKGGVMDNYSIVSFLRRDTKVEQYGENAEVLGYNYFYEQLMDWMLEQIDVQENTGPLEPLNEYIMACEYPKEAIISIGATRYTPYGETTFLQEGDESIVIVYDNTKYSLDNITTMVKDKSYAKEDISVLSQTIRHHE
jgi:hypothetical protein